MVGKKKLQRWALLSRKLCALARISEVKVTTSLQSRQI